LLKGGPCRALETFETITQPALADSCTSCRRRHWDKLCVTSTDRTLWRRCRSTPLDRQAPAAQICNFFDRGHGWGVDRTRQIKELSRGFTWRNNELLV